MANICSVTMYFYGEKSAVEELHRKMSALDGYGKKGYKATFCAQYQHRRIKLAL